jgi:hypothetical protein
MTLSQTSEEKPEEQAKVLEDGESVRLDQTLGTYSMTALRRKAA